MFPSLRQRITHSLAFSLAMVGAVAVPLTLSAPALAQSKLVQADVERMTLERLETVLQSAGDNVQGGAGQWQVTLDGRNLLVLANQPNNRMRILTPVIAANELQPQQVQSILIANFHTALDARYAVTEGTVVAMYVHPLASLRDDDLRSALRQVASLAETFGESYSSGELLFDQNAPLQAEPDGEVEVRDRSPLNRPQPTPSKQLTPSEQPQPRFNLPGLDRPKITALNEDAFR